MDRASGGTPQSRLQTGIEPLHERVDPPRSSPQALENSGFALSDSGILFSGDHVMGWSTSVISPPDGDMTAYLASLDKCLGRDDAVYWPTHGPAITEPQTHVRAFIAHRGERETGVLESLAAGIGDIDKIVERLYLGLEPGLWRAAGRSVHAHLIDLVSRGIVASEGPPTLDTRYRLLRS